MRRGIAGVAILMLFTLAGCATRVADMPMDTSLDRGCKPGHIPPSTIAVVVYLDANGEVQVLPDEIVVEHPNQTIVWTAADGEIEDIVFKPSECAPGPPSVNGKGRQLSTRIPPGLYRGSHKYGFTFYPTGGRPEPIDPLIVVEY